VYLPLSHASSAAGQETLVGIVGPDFILLGADSSISQSIALTASNLDKIAVIVDPFPSGRLAKREVIESDYQQQTIVAAAAGDAADADRLLGVLRAHAAIREYEASVGCDVQVVDLSKKDTAVSTSASPSLTPAGLSVEATARLARGQIASQLRSRTPFRVCLLVAGMMPSKDLDETSSLLTTEVGLSYNSEQIQQQIKSASSPYLAHSSTKEITRDTNNNKLPSLSKLRPYLYWLDEYGSMQKLQYGAHGHGSNFILSILDQGYRPDLTRKEAADLLHECFAQLRMRYVINSPQKPCIKCVDAEGCRLLR
jgi:20S proteasome alpha/beta subunit